jgi:hypothetical protein
MQQSYAEHRHRLSKHDERERVYSARLASGNVGYQKIKLGKSALETNPFGVLNCCQQAKALIEHGFAPISRIGPVRKEGQPGLHP